MSEQSVSAPLTPERLAQYSRAAQDAIHSYHGDRCSLTIQARDLLALCELAARGLLSLRYEQQAIARSFNKPDDSTR
jgi:hypothetical protein